MQQANTATNGQGQGAIGQPSQPVLTLRNGKIANPWLVLMSLVFGFFMSLLDITIVNIALTNIQAKLNTDLTSVTWVLSAYSLVFAILLVTIGRLADQFGRKRLFMIGMVVFSAGSLLCALSPTIGWLIGFRAFQAIGAAALNSVSLAIIIAVFPRERRGAAIGIYGALSGIATAIGPVLGGFLVQNFDWRWIFFVNLPFCIVGLYMVARFVPETREPNTSKKLDIPGLITLSVTMLCLVLAILQGNVWGWNSPAILSLFAGAFVGLVLFIIAEIREAEPIIDFSLFKIRSFVSSSISMFLFGVAIQGAFLILVLYFVNALGDSQIDAAYAILPIPIAAFIVSAFSGAFSAKINPRFLGIAGLGLLAIGFGLLYTITPDATYLDTAWRNLIIGAGMGLCFQSYPNIALSDVPRAKLGVGSGVFNTFRQVGFVLGIAILISLFTGNIQTNIAQARSNAVQVVQSDTKVPTQLRNGIVLGLQSSAANNSNGQNATTRSVDLTPFADNPNIPVAERAALKAELKSLGDRIAAQFKRGVVDTFTLTWLVSACVAVLGFLSAFFTFAPRRKQTEQQASGEGEPSEDASAFVIS